MGLRFFQTFLGAGGEGVTASKRKEANGPRRTLVEYKARVVQVAHAQRG